MWPYSRWDSELEGFSITDGPTSARVLRHAHNIKLNSYLMQTVAVQEIRKVYLNTPYTKCIPTTTVYEEDYCNLVYFFNASCAQVCSDGTVNLKTRNNPF